MNLVFLIVLLLTVAGAFVSWRKTRGDDERTREGPIPGYSYTDGSELDLREDVSLPRGEAWEARSIETFNSPGRPRIVLALDLRQEVDEDALRDFLHECAQDVIRRTRARVFFAETYRGDRPHAYYMWSPDGGGWTGNDGRNEVFVPVG